MKKIDFFIVGAPKCGTTSFYYYLKELPDFIQMPLLKEVKVFSNDKLYQEVEENIPKFYTNFSESNDKKIGLADVNLLTLAHKTAKRIHKYNEDAKVLVFLRDPVERACSAYNFLKYNRNLDVPSIAENLEKDKNIEATSEVDLKENYLISGLYYDQINTYINIFGREKVKIILLEDFLKDKEKIFKNCLKFILDDEYLREEVDYSFLKKRFNRSGKSKIPAINYLIKRSNIFKNKYKQLIPLSLRINIRKYILNPLISKNIEEKRFATKTPEITKKLKCFYKSDIDNLSELLDRNLHDIWS